MASPVGPEAGLEPSDEASRASGSLKDAVQHQEEPLVCLLALPDFLLDSIIGHLALASDVCSVAAACAPLRQLCCTTRLPGVTSFVVDRWTPGLSASLHWAATWCVQLQQLDLSGATACSDADLLPLTQLSTLTSLQLGGLWRIQGTTARPGAAGRGGSASLEVLSAILGSNRGLLSLDLSGTAVPVGAALAAALAQVPGGRASKGKPAFGLRDVRLAGCRRAGGGGVGTLRHMLTKCCALTRLDLSGCRWITSGSLPQDNGNPESDTTALGQMPLRHVSFAGCELLTGIGWLLSSWQDLETLDLSGTAVGEADVYHIASSCASLRSLNLSRCTNMPGCALDYLQHLEAVMLGCLRELRLADLAWVTPERLKPLLDKLSHTCPALNLQLDLSGCGGVSDSSLLCLVDPASQLPVPEQEGDRSYRYPDSGSSVAIEELRLSGSPALTAEGLLRVARSLGQPSCPPPLTALRHLDVSHVRCLRSKTAASDAARLAAQALATLCEAAGPSLRVLSLDGCFAGYGLLPLLARCCTGLETLSLVGCTGLRNADLQALTTLHTLRDLALGGSNLSWHEHHALAGLSGLTRLHIARRPFLTDAQLAPLLAANRSSLVRLELAGCAALTDDALLPLLHSGQAGGEHGVGSSDTRPRRQQQRPRLQACHLVCCEGLIGASLRHLVGLRSLRLTGSPAISESAIQAACICCTQLTLLELPNHIGRGAVPVAPANAASHLLGLQVLGGEEEGGGGGRGSRWRRRAGRLQ